MKIFAVFAIGLVLAFEAEGTSIMQEREIPRMNVVSCLILFYYVLAQFNFASSGTKIIYLNLALTRNLSNAYKPRAETCWGYMKCDQMAR